MIDIPIVELSTMFDVRERNVPLANVGKPPNESALRELILADTDEKMLRFIDEWQPLFQYVGASRFAGCGDEAYRLPHNWFCGEYCVDTLIDYIDARKMIILAICLKSLLDDDRCTMESLMQLGLVIEEAHAGRSCRSNDGGQVRMNHFQSLTGKYYSSYLHAATIDMYTPISDYQLVGVNALSSSVRSRINEKLPSYAEKLKIDNDNSLVLYLRTHSHPNTEDGLRALVVEALDELIAIHLYDIRTLTMDGGREYRRCGSLLSSFWYCMVRGFEGGRAGRCVVCGKPYISMGERGKPRKYCSPKCNKWAQRNPGKTR